MTLRLPDSGAEVTADGRRHAPSALRNAAPILAVLRRVVRPGVHVLELASGTGQHAAEFAPALGAFWQPSDVDTGNFTSITAWTGDVAGVLPPVLLDAGQAEWSARHAGVDVILGVNILHLIAAAAARNLVDQAALALGPGGRLALYGPFLRDGRTTSDGDAAFDASLRAQDPRIGYKDLGQVLRWMGVAGLGCEVVPMPANNLMLLAFRP